MSTQNKMIVNHIDYPKDYGQHTSYLRFIKMASKYSQKQAQKGAKLTEHHIVPTHYSKNKKSETVLLTYRYHALAHKILYQLHSVTWDFCAYRGLIAGNDEVRQLVQQAIVEKNRQNQTGFFNPKVQLELSKRPKSSYYFQTDPEKAKQISQLGGIASGKIWTETKIKTAVQNGKNVGINYGRKGGLKMLLPETKEKIGHIIHWIHKTGVTVKTLPQEGISEYVTLLNLSVPDSVKHSSGISAIIRGVEPCRYGWKIAYYE